MVTWKKDKTSSLSSWEDYSLYFFDKLDYIDKEEAIMASFPNFRTGELISAGYAEYDDYDNEESISSYNYPGLVYYNESTDRLQFKVSTLVGNRNQYDENNLETPSGGQVLGANQLITLLANDTTVHPFSGTYSILSSSSIQILPPEAFESSNRQVFGEVILKNHIDDPENGLNYYESLVSNLHTLKWDCTLPEWTESEITINKADFWGRDSFTPEK
jgi:hypothetical protein